MQFDSNWWYPEATRLRKRINNLPFESKIPLVRLSNQLDHMVSLILKEEIVCRRKGRQTDKHAELLEQFRAMRDDYDNNTTLALLMQP
jgi:predicted transposase YbfD/YdcC